jgi:hypothetical protein
MWGVDSFRDRVPIKKTTQGRLNESQILHLGVTIRLIDRSQGKKNKISITNPKKTTVEVSFRTY